ncbi:MAG: M20/M25/M40 family metallo-hydrolase [Algicola sp.]|nr:M20/M25/M40 family metallo-hydrolase [Algicola sp.]
MKHIVLLFSVFMLFNCENAKGQVQQATVSSEEIKNMVTYLSADSLHGRNTGTAGIENAAVYIETMFKQFNVSPYFESYRDHFEAKGKAAFNMVGFLEGNDPKLKNEVVIVGAHYDHIGVSKKIVATDSIANGANDNASGVSTVLAVAKYLSEHKTNKRSVMFALFSAEEMGLLGSEHLANKLKSQNINLYTMVNIEMVGVPFKDRDYTAFITGYNLSNMAERINHYTNTNFIGFSEVAQKYNLFRQSDNYAFYQAFKLPCHTISSCDLSNYDYYHHVDDEADKLDYSHMANLISKLIPAIEAISNTPTQEIKLYE